MADFKPTDQVAGGKPHRDAQGNIITNDASDDLSSRYLTFYIGTDVFGVTLNNVIEIVGVQNIAMVPSLPYYIKGITNLRGKVVPVMSARLKMGKHEIPYDEKTCNIVISVHDMQVGLIVDSVSEVVSGLPDELAPLPKGSMEEAAQFLSSIIELENKVVLNINLDKFFASDLAGLYY